MHKFDSILTAACDLHLIAGGMPQKTTLAIYTAEPMSRP